MKITVDFELFKEKFNQMNRQEMFSLEGLKVLYDYLIDIENECGYEMELDVVAICCQFAEYMLKDFNNEFNKDYNSINEALEGERESGYIVASTKETVIVDTHN